MAPPNGILKKAAFAAPFVLTFGWGLVFYPDAPLRECNGQFFGKWGRPHTAEEYHHFMIWQTWFIALWLFGLAFCFWKRLGAWADNDI
jgi:hypothetical protein